MFDKLKSFPYFKEVAFVVAVLVILWAWKLGVEGIVE